MMALPRPKSLGFPCFPQTADRPSGAASRVFGPEFEAEYVRARLLGNRTLIRVTCTFSVLLTAFRGAEQAIVGFWHPAQPVGLALVLAASVALALIVWTRAFERSYLPLARVFVPARNAVAAVFIAGTAAHGQLEMLMFLPLMILGPYFFLGLSCRAALFSGVLCFASFNLSAAAFGLALPVALRVSALLIVAVVACTIAARHLEKLSRKSFLDSHRISALAQHDALTGLKNRRVFDEQLSRLWQQAVEDRRSIAMLLIDVDHFKPFNDRYGHQAGDQALQRVAQTLQAFVSRPLDVLARYGGEEFAVILYDIDAREAEELAERMRRAVSELAIEHHGSRVRATLTISVGVALIEPSRDRQARGALQLADQALYEAKIRGRNRVTLMDQTAHRLLETGVFRRAQLARGA
jgi:diguanylate cyclase (GGDEF)-like protein